jgi:biopolymer transport protein ExbD
MLRKLRAAPKLFSDFNTLQFAGVMAMVAFVLLLMFMTVPTASSRFSADLPSVSHPVSMPGALREDAMLITVLRDGQVYFGNDRVRSDDLAQKIQSRLKDRDVERKVYVKADLHAHWGTVKSVLHGVHSAGVIRVAFIVYERRSPVVTP